VCEKSIGTKINNLDFRLEVVSGSCLLWRYIRHWISRKPLETEAWFQRTINRKWLMDYQMVTWPMTSCDPERSNSWPQYSQSAISRKRLEIDSGPVQGTNSRKWHISYHMVTWQMASRNS